MTGSRKKTGFGLQRGNALLVGIMFSGIVAFSVGAFLSVVTQEIPMQIKRIDRNRSMEIADAGIEHTLWQINSDHDWWNDVCENYEEGVQSDDAELISSEATFEEGEHYEVDVDYLADSQSGRPTFFIRATGYVERELASGETMETLKTMAVMTRPEGFSDFARFVASGNLSYAAGATLDGKVHTNGDLNVNGTVDRPIIFRRRVSVSGSVNGYSEGTTYFYDELEVGADTVPLPDDTLQYATLAQNGGIYLDDYPEYYDAPTDKYYIDLSMLSYPPGFNGVVYCTKDVKVHGTPIRPVTVVSADDIYVTDHIYQGYDPRHVVGLIAQDYIYLDESTPDNLEVNAALMSFGATWRALGSGDKVGLTIRGSIVTKYGGSAGPYLAGERHYIFDRRLLFYMPPSFPDFPGGSYVLTAWLEAPGESDWRNADVSTPDTTGY